jgi:hypothetical protein
MTNTNSKKVMAKKVFKKLMRRKELPARKVFISALKDEVGLSDNGASTYYQNIKLKRAGW